MSNLSPEQIETVKQILEKAVQQQIAQGKLSEQVTAQHLLPSILEIINALPGILGSLITVPGSAVIKLLTTLIHSLIGILASLLGSTGITGSGVAPNLINIIKKEIPIPNKVNK